MVDKEQNDMVLEGKREPKTQKRATRRPLFDDEKGYLPLFVLISCEAAISSFSKDS